MIAIDLSPLVLDPRRGVSRALRHLLLGLRPLPRAGLRVEGWIPTLAVDDPDTRVRCDGLDHVHVLPVPPRPRQVWGRALRRMLARREARVLLTPWAAFPTTDVPVVAWIHEVPFARLGTLEGGLRTLRHRRALARAVDRARALVVPSHAVRNDLLEVHPEAARRVHVVPHGFAPEGWSVTRVDDETTTMTAPLSLLRASGSSDTRAIELALRHDEPYVVLVGTGRGAGGPFKKGVDVFAGAFRDGRVGGLTGVVVGTAPGLPDGIRVVDEPSDAALAALISQAHVLVVPSRSEGFGYPMLEAFAAGVPVVASAAGALPEVSGGAARLVPPGDADALREAITRVATDEVLRARMIKDGKQRAQDFPVEAMARGWLRVLCQAGDLPCPV
jgi:glycosyltransferase involved in cell wall biosynthesis